VSGIDFLADTNIIIQINQGEQNMLPFLDYSFAVSFITEIELLGAYNFSKEIKKQYGDLIQDCVILNISDDIKEKCIYLRNNYKIKTPDAIIAATAIVHNLTLLTSDQDFTKIKELSIVFIEKI